MQEEIYGKNKIFRLKNLHSIALSCNLHNNLLCAWSFSSGLILFLLRHGNHSKHPCGR
jgi:hypothetical protein